LDERKNVSIPAHITDSNGNDSIECLIRDVCPDGCRLVAKHIHDLPDQLLLTPQGFSQPIEGHVVWRSKSMAGIALDWPDGKLGQPDAK